MVASFLGINYRSGTTPQLVLYTIFGTFSQGNAFGSLDTGTSTIDLPFNRVINFNTINHSPAEPGGIYVAANDTIWKSIDNGVTWSAVHTLVDISSANTACKSGLNIVYVNGQPTMCITYKGATTTQWYGAYSIDGTTWVTQGPYALFALSGATCVSNDHVYNNVLCCTVHSASGGNSPVVLEYDPGAGVLNFFFPAAATATSPASICEFNNELYMLYLTGTPRWRLARVTGSTIVDVDTDITGGAITVSTESIPTMWVEGSFLYVLIYGSTGLRCYQYSSTFTKVDLTSTVLPAALSTTASVSHVAALVDMQTLPPLPQIYLFHTTSGTAGTTWSAYQWNGPAAVATLVGSGGDSAHALPFNRRALGSYFFEGTSPTTIPGLHIEIVERTLPTSGTGIRLKFRIYGDVVGAVNARFFYGSVNSEYATTICTLQSPSTGTLLGSNIITGLSQPSNGGTLYEVTWRADTDGFSVGSRYRLVADAFYS